MAKKTRAVRSLPGCSCLNYIISLLHDMKGDYQGAKYNTYIILFMQ